MHDWRKPQMVMGEECNQQTNQSAGRQHCQGGWVFRFFASGSAQPTSVGHLCWFCSSDTCKQSMHIHIFDQGTKPHLPRVHVRKGLCQVFSTWSLYKRCVCVCLCKSEAEFRETVGNLPPCLQCAMEEGHSSEHGTAGRTRWAADGRTPSPPPMAGSAFLTDSFVLFNLQDSLAAKLEVECYFHFFLWTHFIQHF